MELNEHNGWALHVTRRGQRRAGHACEAGAPRRRPPHGSTATSKDKDDTGTSRIMPNRRDREGKRTGTRPTDMAGDG